MKGYIGAVVLLNTVVQCLLLLGTKRLYRDGVRWQWIALGGIVGGVYAGICLMDRFVFLQHPLWRLTVLVLMAVLAFGVDDGMLRRSAVFILLNMALEGITVGLGSDSLLYCALAVAVLGVLYAVGFHDRNESQRFVPVEMSYGGKTVHFTALRDTGNMLTDPLTGQSVMVVSAQVACQLTGLTPQQIRDPLNAIVNAGIPKLRLIPYRTVGQSSAFLLALRMHVKLGDKGENCLVAFAPEVFGKESTYQALTGGIV